MLHLTLTGYFAGKLICNKSKELAINEGDTFAHFMYYPEKLVYSNPDLCPDCKELAIEIIESE